MTPAYAPSFLAHSSRQPPPHRQLRRRREDRGAGWGGEGRGETGKRGHREERRKKEGVGGGEWEEGERGKEEGGRGTGARILRVTEVLALLGPKAPLLRVCSS